MTLIVFCNVGNRDVQMDDRTVTPARAEGERLLQDLDNVRDRLTFPIVTAVLRELLKLDNHISQLIFIGTNQDDDKYKTGDTLYFAELMAAVIPERFAGQIDTADFLTVGEGRNPSLYDEAWEEFNRVLRPFASEKEATCIVSPAGGIPACNTALILQGIHLFGERCHIYYQTPDEAVIPLAIGSQVLGFLRQNSLREALARFDFTTAASLYAASDKPDKLVQALLDYGAARLRFDFQSAYSHLNQAIAASSGRTRTHLRQISQDIDRLMAGDDLARIAELFYNARIAWDNGRFNEFLSRVVRLQTAVLQLQIPLLYQGEADQPSQTELRSLSVQPGLRRSLLRQLRLIRNQPVAASLDDDPNLRVELRGQLDQHFNLNDLKALCFYLGVDDEHIAGDEKLSKITNLITHMNRRGRLAELIRAAGQQRPRADWFQQPTAATQNQAALADAVTRLDTLVELQNDSIAGFGYLCISPELIAQTYPRLANGEAATPIADMADICLALGIHLTNPFLDTCELILESLQNADV